MTYETVEALKRGNTASVSEVDLVAINALIERIEAERSDASIPRAGDRVLCLLNDGLGTVYTEHALIEKIEDDGRISICARGASAHIFPETLTLSVSGGPFFYAQPGELEYVGTTVQGEFWTWNQWGMGGNHGITFSAEVNYWRIVAPYRRFI